MSISDPRVAVRSALAQYLKAQLPGVSISENWPTAVKALVMPAVTVLASSTVRTAWHQPMVWRTTPIKGAQTPKGDVLYSYGKAEINMQLDCWAGFEATRDKLAQQVEAVINRPPEDTLNPDPNRLKSFSVRPGLVLKVGGYYDTYCEFIFEAVASDLPENNFAAQTNEWRQAYTGTANFYVCNEEQMALLKAAIAVLDINDEKENITAAFVP